MKFTTFCAAALAVGAASVVAVPSPGPDIDSFTFGKDISRGNFFGAPNPPGHQGAAPGWYFGKHPTKYPHIPCLSGPICRILKFFPKYIQCPKPPPPSPPPSDGYTQTFANLTGATQAADYITFGLVDTIADCKAMCNSVAGCGFANSYDDVNGKDGSTQLTCSLYTSCHTAADATNMGGQTQPDGTVDLIANSDGWCKST